MLLRKNASAFARGRGGLLRAACFFGAPLGGFFQLLALQSMVECGILRQHRYAGERAEAKPRMSAV
jgi:hypothetical protein